MKPTQPSPTPHAVESQSRTPIRTPRPPNIAHHGFSTNLQANGQFSETGGKRKAAERRQPKPRCHSPIAERESDQTWRRAIAADQGFRYQLRRRKRRMSRRALYPIRWPTPTTPATRSRRQMQGLRRHSSRTESTAMAALCTTVSPARQNITHAFTRAAASAAAATGAAAQQNILARPPFLLLLPTDCSVRGAYLACAPCSHRPAAGGLLSRSDRLRQIKAGGAGFSFCSPSTAAPSLASAEDASQQRRRPTPICVGLSDFGVQLGRRLVVGVVVLRAREAAGG